MRTARTAVERFDEDARARFGAHGRTFVGENELLRHPVYTRFLHWSVAAFFHYIMEGPKEPQPQPPGQELKR